MMDMLLRCYYKKEINKKKLYWLLQELQQHDVQELNRILFSAVESSLVGTSGEQLISKFYHGTSVQQVHVCCMCCKQM